MRRGAIDAADDNAPGTIVVRTPAVLAIDPALDVPGCSHPSKAPTRIAAGMTTSHATVATRNHRRVAVEATRDDHCHRNTAGMTLCSHACVTNHQSGWIAA